MPPTKEIFKKVTKENMFQRKLHQIGEAKVETNVIRASHICRHPEGEGGCCPKVISAQHLRRIEHVGLVFQAPFVCLPCVCNNETRKKGYCNVICIALLFQREKPSDTLDVLSKN